MAMGSTEEVRAADMKTVNSCEVRPLEVSPSEVHILQEVKKQDRWDPTPPDNSMSVVLCKWNPQQHILRKGSSSHKINFYSRSC